MYFRALPTRADCGQLAGAVAICRGCTRRVQEARVVTSVHQSLAKNTSHNICINIMICPQLRSVLQPLVEFGLSGFGGAPASEIYQSPPFQVARGVCIGDYFVFTLQQTVSHKLWLDRCTMLQACDREHVCALYRWRSRTMPAGRDRHGHAMDKSNPCRHRLWPQTNCNTLCRCARGCISNVRWATQLAEITLVTPNCTLTTVRVSEYCKAHALTS